MTVLYSYIFEDDMLFYGCYGNVRQPVVGFRPYLLYQFMEHNYYSKVARMVL